MGIIWSRSATLTAIPPLEEQSLQIPQQDGEGNDAERKKNIQVELTKFKEELDKKREARRDALTALGKRMADLREEKDKEKEERERLEKELKILKNLDKNDTSRNGIFGNCNDESHIRQLEIELENEKEEKERLMKELEDLKKSTMAEGKLESVKTEEVEGLERQVKALKEVAGISADMLRIRELQVNELTAKLTAIEETGQAYEKEVDNLRRLRKLYEERARAVTISHQMELEREKTRLVASEAKLELAEQKVASLEEQNTELKQRITTLDKSLDEAKLEISELRIELAGKREDLYNATSQMSIINQLFSQVISGPDGLERVTRVLEEHHDLVNHLTAKGKINDLASTLLELADKEEQGHVPTEEEQDIAANLGKVWRLLVELLGHHAKPVSGTVEVIDSSLTNPCYKSIDTPKGPKLVISVSQTFLRLKDLILEKNSLVKEVGRLKDLNSTLETRLVEQEGRLVVVASELHKTWDVVNKLRAQHKHLHTNEQVLRYELAQKRLMLNEMKKELENCRENWELARAKNSKTEEDWKILRKEFAARKQINSAESGYEESPGDSQDEEEWSAKEEMESLTKEDKQLAEVEMSTPSSKQCKMVDKDLLNTQELQDNVNLIGQEEVKSAEEVEEVATDELNITVEKPAKMLPANPKVTNEQCERNEEACCSNSMNSTEEYNNVPKEKTAEERLKAREDRLKRLEEQCKGLFNKMNQTSQRSDLISNRLVELHEHYGEEGRLRKQQRNESIEEDHTATTSSENSNNNNLTSTNLEIQSTSSNECLTKPTPDLDPDPKT